VRPLQKSPTNPYVCHPASNPDQYNTLNHTIELKGKANQKYHNSSTLQLTSSLGELVPIKFDERKTSKKKKSCRKHFDRYFIENYDFI